MDQKTLDILRDIHHQLHLDEEAPYEEVGGVWEEELSGQLDIQYLYCRFVNFTEKICKKFKRVNKIQRAWADTETEHVGDELIQQLIDAWNLYTRGANEIPCRDIGYVLRILGQNPTEDDIMEMVMKANCDWEGIMTRNDFIEERIFCGRAATRWMTSGLPSGCSTTTTTGALAERSSGKPSSTSENVALKRSFL